MSALADPQIVRRALDALALRLDGSRAAAATITRKRAVFGNWLGYAVEVDLLEANPLVRISWRPGGERTWPVPDLPQTRSDTADPGRGHPAAPTVERVL